MAKIFTPYGDEKPKRQPNKPGNIMEQQYKERYDENGNAYLEQVGEINVSKPLSSLILSKPLINSFKRAFCSASIAFTRFFILS